MRGRGDDFDPLESRARRESVAQLAEPRPRRDDFGKHAGGRPNLRKRSKAHCRVGRMKALRRRGVREFDRRGCPHRHQWKKSGINSSRSAAASRSAVRPLKGQQLKQRVELHELQAGLREDLALGNAAERLRENAFRPRVAIVIRLTEQLAVARRAAHNRRPTCRRRPRRCRRRIARRPAPGRPEFRTRAAARPSEACCPNDTAPLGKRCICSKRTRRPSNSPAITRPLSAPKSTPR